jgi:hypothetical protein
MQDIPKHEFDVISQALVVELTGKEVEAGLSRNTHFMVCYDNATALFSGPASALLLLSLC